MPLLIKLLMPFIPRLIEFFIEVIINVLKKQVKNTNSKVDDNLVEILESEKSDLTTMAIAKTKESGIYKKIATMGDS